MSIDQLPRTEKAPDWGDDVAPDPKLLEGPDWGDAASDHLSPAQTEADDWGTGPLEGSHDDIMNKLHETPAVKKGLARRALDKVMGSTPQEVSLQAEKDIMFTPEAMNPNNPAAVGGSIMERSTRAEATTDNDVQKAIQAEEDAARDLRIARDERMQLLAERNNTTGFEAQQRVDAKIAENEKFIGRLQKTQQSAENAITDARHDAHAALQNREQTEASLLAMKRTQ
jgi:hypothetical protein